MFSISVVVARPIEIPSLFSHSTSEAEDKLSSSGGGGGVVRVKGVSCGDFHTAVLTVDNRLLMWGEGELKGTSGNDDANLQSGAMRDISHLVPAGKQIKQVCKQ